MYDKNTKTTTKERKISNNQNKIFFEMENKTMAKAIKKAEHKMK